MPNEFAIQLPVLKDILKAMNITLIEKEGYEADDILGTLSKRASDGLMWLYLQVTGICCAYYG